MLCLDALSVEALLILRKHASPLTCQFLIPSPAFWVQPAAYVRCCKMYRVCSVQMKEAGRGAGAGMCGKRGGETRIHAATHAFVYPTVRFSAWPPRYSCDDTLRIMSVQRHCVRVCAAVCCLESNVLHINGGVCVRADVSVYLLSRLFWS